MKKILVVGAVMLSAVLMSTTANAVDISHSTTTSTSNSVTDYNKVVTGNVLETEFKYSVDRDSFGGQSCKGVHCQGNVDNNTVGVTIDVLKKETVMVQTMSGVINAETLDCSTTVSINGMSATEGVRTGTTSSKILTDNNNVTKVTGGTIEVATSTNEKYTGDRRLGNDFGLDVNGIQLGSNIDSIDVQGAVTALTDGSQWEYTITGQDLNAADENGLSVKLVQQDLNIEDLSQVVQESVTTTTTVYSSLK